MRRKRWMISVLVYALLLSSFSGCAAAGQKAEEAGEADKRTGESSRNDEESQDGSEESEEKTSGEGKEFDGVTLTMLNFSSATPKGVISGACKAAEEKFGFEIEIEPCTGDDVVRTRLATGECPDLLVYNTGSLLSSLNPSEFFLDLTDTDIAKTLDEDFIRAASVDGVLYGIPQCDSMGAGVYYNKEFYEKYDLQVPETWEEFMGNMEVLKNAGITGMGMALNELVYSQLPFLADNYQLMHDNPDFPEEFTAGEIKFAGSREGIRTWERYEELSAYFNEDCTSATGDEIERKMFDNEVAHLINFSSRIPAWCSLYGEEMDKIGFFALPGDTKEKTGLTIWPANAIYGSKNSKNIEAVEAFLEWYASDEGLDVLTSLYSPVGAFHTGYKPKGEQIEVVKEVQQYYTEGRITSALEYLSPVKGINCQQICNELGSGRITAREAAAAYDEECKRMALQLGLWS
jgi:ABC-type glycerol-3-phosphate transport system substrate-binding protein